MNLSWPKHKLGFISSWQIDLRSSTNKTCAKGFPRDLVIFLFADWMPCSSGVFRSRGLVQASRDGRDAQSAIWIVWPGHAIQRFVSRGVHNIPLYLDILFFYSHWVGGCDSILFPCRQSIRYLYSTHTIPIQYTWLILAQICGTFCALFQTVKMMIIALQMQDMHGKDSARVEALADATARVLKAMTRKGEQVQQLKLHLRRKWASTCSRNAWKHGVHAPTHPLLYGISCCRFTMNIESRVQTAAKSTELFRHSGHLAKWKLPAYNVLEVHWFTSWAFESGFMCSQYLSCAHIGKSMLIPARDCCRLPTLIISFAYTRERRYKHNTRALNVECGSSATGADVLLMKIDFWVDRTPAVDVEWSVRMRIMSP